MPRNSLWLAVPVAILLATSPPRLQARRERSGQVELQAPAGDRPVKIDPTGDTVLPNGRLITPRGTYVKVAPHPYGMALSPDGKTLVTDNSGTAPFSLSIITELQSSQPNLVALPQIPDIGRSCVCKLDQRAGLRTAGADENPEGRRR
jgi:hypothetical protein